ncbi:MAG TPA: threonine/serine dehydratase [Hyphomicrobiaceae bacterium]|jgi:threonine dehydratase|nr:threonine/serine dehydratase [Hyphomicrobiaceae bacterium]
MARPMPTYADVVAARARIGALACRTPLIEHPALNAIAGGRVLLKAENLQRVGAFKFRGAYNKVAQVDGQAYPGGVVACSSGNHAQGVAAAATLRGLKSTIVMPSDAPRLKIERTKAFGGEVVPYDRTTEDRDAIAREICRTRNAAYVHPFDDPDVIAGQGTVGIEMMEQAGALELKPDIVLVGVSGGGLIGGVSLAVKETSPATQIYSVEPAGFDDLARSLARGARERNLQLSGSICDALMAATPGELTFEMAQRNLAGGLAVTDEEAKAAVRFAFRELKLVVEPGGAVSLAAILARKMDFAGKTVMAVLSGGNIDPALFAEIILEPQHAQ